MNDGHSPGADLREICHDIRQPIAGVLALAGAAAAEAELAQDVRSRLEQIVELAEWQSDVVETGRRSRATPPRSPARPMWSGSSTRPPPPSA